MYISNSINIDRNKVNDCTFQQYKCNNCPHSQTHINRYVVTWFSPSCLKCSVAKEPSCGSCTTGGWTFKNHLLGNMSSGELTRK